MDAAWAKALAAADFDSALVLPSLMTDDAFVATAGDVVLLGAFAWLSVLAAADFDLAPVLVLLSTLDALVAAAGLVTFDFAIFSSSFRLLMSRVCDWSKK